MEERKKSIAEQLEEIQSLICDRFCKYGDTTDDDYQCDWLKAGNSCPLDRLL